MLDRPAMRPIDSIIVGERFRKDMGDLEALAQSIAEDGLLQPVVVSQRFILLAGERRLRACRDILGWTDIPVRIMEVNE